MTKQSKGKASVVPVPRRRRNLVRGVLAVSVVANVVLLAMPGGPAVGAWRSAEGRAEYVAAYEDVMATLPPPARTHDVPTDYGTVRAYLFAETGSGAPDANASTSGTAGDAAGTTPVVLLPGWGSGAPMWQTNLPDLMSERPVYALDALGDAGMSAQVAPLGSPASQARWIDQTLAGLGVGRAHVVGHSFGGWSAMNYAIHHPARVASLSLLDPVQTFDTFSVQLVLRSIPSSIPFLPQSWRDAALAGIGGVTELDPDDPMTRMIAAGTTHYSSRRPTPSRFSPEQLQGLPVPVYAAMAGDGQVNSDPEAAVRYAEEHLARSEVSLWPGASHSLPFEEAEAVDAEILDFMERHDA
ncbi:alpha/beta fold hydrolase [Myceligenerans salitolerans]|uniref:Alpha/beta hydrolase n=1 Tax=Myceligenerans salitolerans TaxID=1230528 RepID=A0ABS3ICI8_9MICO|nr:alpha/beta hydrolase [Myceligenerans salitolerans]MBO0610658.1 alpha/beta hydrolase [Myceligenerans salitolerans]